ncbi:glycosyltransferase [Mesorhizobium sp. M7A.F.Ca.US.006.04.2.1]|uniref:glycosyltransferase n=3 Tax=Mesorhizobium TaxID=68287 RepID=UPI000FCA9134|nr:MULTISPECIES: glycosyltransferase [unclassified Mesorhizobium]RUX75753.1 glycosyltransferase [Mesorhizobium sp. M7A.F.Ca.US.005.03.1.1]RVA95234.1 glycosyltransferase [Mesorhizobium sp. M7A.F.Ca.US.006.04.2.1]
MNKHPAAENTRDAAPVDEPKARKAKPKAARRTCIMVLGMHRSGTSALTRAISLLGAELPKNLLGANPTNPTGHWEPSKLIALHDQMLAEAGSRWDDWRRFDLSDLSRARSQFYKAEIAHLIDKEYGGASLFVLKEPRISRFVQLYADIFESMKIDLRYVLASRNPLAVIASLSKRDRSTPGFGALLWLRHELDAEHSTRGAPRAFVSYEGMMQGWRPRLDKIAAALSVAWPRSMAAAAVDIDAHISTDYRHHAATDGALFADERIASWVKDTYSALKALESDANDAKAMADLDRVKAEFDAVAPIFGEAFFPELRARQQISSEAQLSLQRAVEEQANRATQLAAELQQKDTEIAAYRRSLADERAAAEKTLEGSLEERRLVHSQLSTAVEHNTRLTEMLEKTRLELKEEKRRFLAERSQEMSKIYAETDSTPDSSEVAAESMRMMWIDQLVSTKLVQRLRQSRVQRGSWLNVAKAIYSRVALKGVRQVTLDGVALLRVPDQRIAGNLSREREDVASRFSLATFSISSFDGPTISILMPVYRPPIRFLERAILSVIAQEYQNWELVIVDDCSQDEEIKSLLDRYASADKRVKIDRLLENGGISKATNQALSRSSGEYIALLDHDDILTKDALLRIAEVVVGNPLVDFIYSDECKVDANDQPVEIFCKPDWSPHLLFNCMYTAHLTAYRKSLVQQVGGFRSEYDFSQDYDLALRAAERFTKVVHIERVLYGWRMIEGSAAVGGKDHARTSNIMALEDAIRRRRYGGEALALPYANRVHRGSDLVSGNFVSIVVPSDNIENIRASINSILNGTDHHSFEVIVVTNGEIIKSLGSISEKVKFSTYDKPFNFSDKCNQGAHEAMGKYVVFFNDDVRVISKDWLTCLLEVATLENVGIVGPKLLYENNLIQHAGMVTGVRGLVGTAFHCLPDMTSDHYNFAQSVRDVSLICGACLMVSRDVFAEIGGFDAENFPVSHSDVDLCLKVRERGYDCVYSPYSRLYHIGHASIGEVEKKRKNSKLFKRDKADINLLKRWPTAISRDPFYPKKMRDLLYHDSQEEYQVHPPAGIVDSWSHNYEAGKDILIVSHDMTESGAPRVVLDMARALSSAGNFVVVMAPADGPMRKYINELGVTVIVDELLFERHDTVLKFGRNFDTVIVNTVLGWPIISQLAELVPTFWYIHESEFAKDLFSSNLDARYALEKAAGVWVGSKIAGGAVEPFFRGYSIVPYGTSTIGPVSEPFQSSLGDDKNIVVSVLGSYEPRKGQDLAILALDELEKSVRRMCELRLAGRILNVAYHGQIKQMADIRVGVSMEGALSHADYERALHETDILLVSSRDDTLPLVSIDALRSGKILVCSTAVGTADFIEDGVSGYVAKDASPISLAAALRKAISDRDKWREIGDAAKAVFEASFSSEAFAAEILRHLESTRDGDRNRAA